MFLDADHTISRRRTLSGIAATLLAGAAASHSSEAPKANDRTFVLTHGAWLGGWCWKKLTPLLEARGHRVLAPTLTGLGERAHLLSPSVDLTTHVRDIVSVLEYEDLRDVVLVGHSYGGMVIAGVADRAGGRLAHLVYLDAFLPDDGKSVKDYAPLPPVREDGWRVPPPGAPPRFEVKNEHDAAWMEARLGDQPLKTFTEPLHLTNPDKPSYRNSYIACTTAPFFVEAAARAKHRGFRLSELFGSHVAMITQPEKLAGVLQEVANS